MPASDAGRWLEQLIAIRRDTPELAAAIVQVGALTGDPVRDLDEALLASARQRLRDAGVATHASRPLYEVMRASFADTSRAFGEPLPNGLRLDEEIGSAHRQRS